MGEDLVTVGADQEVDQAASVMHEHAGRRLPVVDADGTPVGVVSLCYLAAEEGPEAWHSRIVAPTPDLHREPGPGWRRSRSVGLGSARTTGHAIRSATRPAAGVVRAGAG
ncbi:CBS domain-containing protein [Streptomyces sp. NPDC054794]